MLCPVCKKEVLPAQKFCENCGAPVQTPAYPPSPVNPPPVSPAYPSPQPNQQFYQNQPPAAPPVQTPGVQNSPYPQPAYQQQPPINNNQPVYSGTMPITNGGNNPLNGMPYDPMIGSTDTAVKKKPFMSPKKIIIISVIALLVVIIGIFSFIVIRRKMEHDYIVQNPTLSSFSSVEKYLDETGKNDPVYSLVQNSRNGATLSVNAVGNFNKSSNTSDGEAKLNIGFDKNNGRYYLKIDGGTLFSQYSGLEQGNNSLIELGVDPDKVAVNYDVAGKSGKYYINNKTFRQDITNSIFAYDKDNLLGFKDEAAFNAFIDAYESSIQQITKVRKSDDDLTEMDNSIVNIVRSIERNGNVTVQDGMASLYNGTELSTPSADVITYTFTKASVKQLFNDLKTESKAYITKTIKDQNQAADIIAKIDEGMDQAINSLDSSLTDNFRLIMQVYLDKNSHSILQQTYKMSGMGGAQSDAAVSMNIQYLKSPNPVIKAAYEYKNGSTENTMDLSLSKTDDGNVLRYTLLGELKTNGQTVSSSSVPGSVHASFSYDRSAQKYTLELGTGEDGAHVSYTGNAVINKDMLSLSLNKILNTENAELSLRVNLSTTPPPAVNTSGAKNLLEITREEWSNLMGGGFSQPSYDDYDDYYDY